MLIFYAPAAMWTGGLWTAAVILAAGLGAAVLTHRYWVTGTRPALQRRAGAVRAAARLRRLGACARGDVLGRRLLRCTMTSYPTALQSVSNHHLGVRVGRRYRRGRAGVRRRHECSITKFAPANSNTDASTRRGHRICIRSGLTPAQDAAVKTD
jgi:hypothetical protein